MADRIELREQDVATLEDRNFFTLAWLPAPFVPRSALEDGVPRIAVALVPGGWLMVAHGKFQDDELKNAINRLKTSAYEARHSTTTKRRLFSEAQAWSLS